MILFNKDKNCHYDTSLDFIENNRISPAVFLNQSLVIYLHISNGEHPSNPNLENYHPINNVEGDIS